MAYKLSHGRPGLFQALRCCPSPSLGCWEVGLLDRDPICSCEPCANSFKVRSSCSRVIAKTYILDWHVDLTCLDGFIRLPFLHFDGYSVLRFHTAPIHAARNAPVPGCRGALVAASQQKPGDRVCRKSLLGAWGIGSRSWTPGFYKA